MDLKFGGNALRLAALALMSGLLGSVSAGNAQDSGTGTGSGVAVQRPASPDMADETAAVEPTREGTGVGGYTLLEALRDRKVYNELDQEIGELSDLIVQGDRIAYAVISRGGFLGIGGTEIVVPFGSLTFEDERVLISTVAGPDQIEALLPAQPGLEVGSEP